MNKVTVVGSYIVALVMDTDRIPLKGETIVGTNYHQTHGGKGSNMAACAARLGAETTFLGKIGRDAFGRDFVELLTREGVRLDGVLYSGVRPTAVGFIIFSADGSNLIVIDRGANGDFLPADVERHRSIIEASDVMVSPLEIPLETALAAARVASDRGVPAILNPAPAENLTHYDLRHVFAITPNETEGRVCLGLPPEDPISDEDVALQLLDLGVRHVMLTRGEKGVLWASEGGIKIVPAPAVHVVDTVGAGDAFNAGLAVGLSQDRPLLEAIALGVTTASISTERRETIDSYPRQEHVEARLTEVLEAVP